MENLIKRLDALKGRLLPGKVNIIVCWPDLADPRRLLYQTASGELREHIPQPGETHIVLNWGEPDALADAEESS